MSIFNALLFLILFLFYFIIANESSQDNTKQFPDETDCRADEDFIDMFLPLFFYAQLGKIIIKKCKQPEMPFPPWKRIEQSLQEIPFPAIFIITASAWLLVMCALEEKGGKMPKFTELLYYNLRMLLWTF